MSNLLISTSKAFFISVVVFLTSTLLFFCYFFEFLSFSLLCHCMLSAFFIRAPNILVSHSYFNPCLIIRKPAICESGFDDNFVCRLCFSLSVGMPCNLFLKARFDVSGNRNWDKEVNNVRIFYVNLARSWAMLNVYSVSGRVFGFLYFCLFVCFLYFLCVSLRTLS